MTHVKAVKPSLMNAVFPLFLKHGFIALLFTLAAYVLMRGLFFFGLINKEYYWWILVLVLVIVTVLPLTSRMFVLVNTKYLFYQTHISSEFRFVVVKRHSVPYHQITNVKTDVSLWDRMTGAAEIIVYTAEDKGPDLVLRYIKEPKAVEQLIYSMLRRNPQTHPKPHSSPGK